MKIGTPLEVFVKVVELGSFSEASRYFDVTPSAISRQISQIEDELGARLFYRTTRKQSLTESGEIYHSYALRINAEMSAAKLAVSQLTERPRGILHVTAEKDFAETFILPLLPEFFSCFPEVDLQLSLDTRLVDLVEDAIDIAIRVGHLNDSSLVARKLMSSPSVVCASPAYFKKQGQPADIQALGQHNCLSFRTTASQLLWRLGQHSQFEEVRVNGNFRANSLSILRDAAVMGLGVIYIPQWFVQKEINEGLLQVLNFESQETPVYAVFANNRQLAPKVRVFIDFLAEHLSR
ncbi:LysR family transcriptional regulator [Oceanospirillum sediminis]|uniref:LysR family transcriptional regulator n=1 Tax=Oceanospirillum sediminis TaxID=2760088 RepID=A0A839IQA5_9GAMM|nr:LysR family transcriptional regulator [Oceanospirillum sediminis]MBB1486669.1 LysR family transcriptional regulator [Oceanospirillum sediminis]